MAATQKPVRRARRVTSIVTRAARPRSISTRHRAEDSEIENAATGPSVVASAEAAAAEIASVTAKVGPRKNAVSKAKTLRPASLVQRVYKTIDGELGKLEKQEGLASQDRERASRALSQMVNALEKAVDMQRAMIKQNAKGGDAKSKEALAHAEDLRREIAERLERLNRKRPTGRSAE